MNLQTELSFYADGLKISSNHPQKTITETEAKAYCIRKFIRARKSGLTVFGVTPQKLWANFIVGGELKAVFTPDINDYTERVIEAAIDAVRDHDASDNDEDERSFIKHCEIDFDVEVKGKKIEHCIVCRLEYMQTYDGGDYWNPPYSTTEFSQVIEIDHVYDEDGDAELDIDMHTLTEVINQTANNAQIEKL